MEREATITAGTSTAKPSGIDQHRWDPAETQIARSYSCLRAATGLTRDARHAGQSAANTATAVKMKIVDTSVTGSSGAMP